MPLNSLEHCICTTTMTNIGPTGIRTWHLFFTPQFTTPDDTNDPSVAETGFSHRFTAYKIVEHFFGPSYGKISESNQVKKSFFRISNIKVPCPHAQLRGRTAIKKSWTFFGPWGRDRSQSPPCWIFRVKQIHLSTASERTTRQATNYKRDDVLPLLSCAAK